MEMKPQRVEKLSIVLPVLNEGESLKIMVPILKATVNTPNEVLIVYDFPEDNSLPVAQWLSERYDNIIPVHNTHGRGVPNALRAGFDHATGDTILIAVVDEVFPVAQIADMVTLIEQGCDLVSATRYALGGRRLGGSQVGHFLSVIANHVFRWCSGAILSDSTTGMKMIRRDVLPQLPITAQSVGWAFSFELSIRAQLNDLTLGEVPVTSVDRLFGGASTFDLSSWVKAYWQWFVYGVQHLRKMNMRDKKVHVLSKYQQYARALHFNIIDS